MECEYLDKKQEISLVQETRKGQIKKKILLNDDKTCYDAFWLLKKLKFFLGFFLLASDSDLTRESMTRPLLFSLLACRRMWA
jgi:hypothetical protein